MSKFLKQSAALVAGAAACYAGMWVFVWVVLGVVELYHLVVG